MTSTATWRAALSCALLATTCLATPVFAQSAPALPSVHKNIDGNGVDLTDGSFNFSIVEGSIGSGDSALSMIRTNGRAGWTDELPGRLHRTLSPSNNKISVVFGSRVEFFSLAPSGWTPDKGDGATLEGSGSEYVYRSADGTVVTYGVGGPLPGASSGSGTQFCTEGEPSECDLLPLSIRKPNGRQITLSWEIAQVSTDLEPTLGGTYSYFPRLASVSNEANYAITFIYATDSYGQAGPSPDWFRRTGARFVNQTVAALDWPTVSYAQPSSGVTEVTDIGGRTWRFTEAGSTLSIRRPGSSSDNVVVTRNLSGRVSQVVADGVTTSYAFSDSGNIRTATVTNALNQQSVVTSDLNIGRATSVRDALNRTTNYAYDAKGRLTRVTAPEGNYVENSLDARGNVTQTRAVAKPGSGLADIVTSASFASSCPNVLNCNSPISTTDARGNVTDYTYDGAHGGVLSVTSPAPSAGGVRPQTRYAYTLLNGVYLLASTSACQTQSSCAGTADEVKTTVSYNATTLLPISTSSGSGNGSLTATSAMSYDRLGNLLTVDGPLAGSADTIRYRYDAARQLVGTISPDPDGAGALKHRAQRTTYRSDGKITKVERGTVNDQGDAAWAAFNSLEAVEAGFDASNRQVTSKLVAGGQTHALTQTSYDALGRVECTAVRMNTAAFGALPSSACSLGSEGQYGPDRITKTIYDAAGQVTKVQVAVGTPVQADDVSKSYTSNGQVQALTDGENNRTTYEFDGHGRLAKTLFPVATKGANASNSNDHEQLTYDAAGNVISRRNRAGEVISFSYDALGRATLKNLPGSEPDVTYSYDLLGRVTAATQPGHALGFAYDALGRQLTQTGPHGTVTSSYDIVGRRTRITHPDGFFAIYDYLTTGETSQVRENGATSGAGVLAAFSYDDLGRRTSLTRGSGTATSYSYDPASRLSQLAIDLPGSTNDLTLGFTRNPAGQIATNTRSNDLYSWSQHGSGTTSTTANGLNQIVGWNDPISHDSKGNITAIGSAAYGYSSENLLITAPGYALTYDPLMRFYELVGTNGRRHLYDGDDLVAEYNANGTLAKRFVHGPAIDEPLVWYDAGGTARRFLHADERGSIVTATDSAGSPVATYRYDEYGGWGSGYTGSFLYTGQTGYTELGLYYYKNRWRHPKLDRFMQTDPIGFDDGMNIYAYVRGDPINLTDPMGLCNDDGSPGQEGDDCETIVLTGTRPKKDNTLAEVSFELSAGIPSATFWQTSSSAAEVGGGTETANVLKIIKLVQKVYQKLQPKAKTSTKPPPDLQRPSKTPNIGKPNSKHVNPGSGQVRYYGPDGRPLKDIDSDHIHPGAPTPHVHDWVRGVRSKTPRGLQPGEL